MSDTTQRAARATRAATQAAEENIEHVTRAATQTVEDNVERAAETLRAEMPSSFFDLFDKTIARTKDMHDKMTAVAEHSAEALQEVVSCANRGSAEYRLKLMEIARANANSAFDLARASFEVRSLSEWMDLTLTHQRKQFEIASAQLKELSALTQKVVTETTEPIRSGMAEPFRLAS
jgi:phasin